jgi:carbon-monoxide dehydrogenase medium subunit
MDELFSQAAEWPQDKIRFLAGGTDLLIKMKDELTNPAALIDLKGIPGLSFIEPAEDKSLRIGTLTTISQLVRDRQIAEMYPALAEAASVIGSVQIRNKGTIGGNLCNGSPSSDLAPPLIAFSANARIIGPQGERTLRLENFYLGPGRTAIGASEVLREVFLPPPPKGAGACYLKFCRRGGMDLATVSVACLLCLGPDQRCISARIVMGAVAPTPRRARQAEQLLRGKTVDQALNLKAAELASREASPITDIRATADYRREIIRVLVNRALILSLARAGG